MKLFKMSLTAALALSLTGCLVGDEEYDAALRQRDEYRGQLRELYQANDTLNQEVARLYAECGALSDRLALVAASSVQREFAGDIQTVPARQRSRPRGTN